MKKLIIIPAYNEAENLEKTIAEIQKNASSFDYIIINDCSTDNTKELCKKNDFNVINLPINLGIGGAVQTGYLYAARNGYDAAVQIDGDGQHDTSFLNELYEEMTKRDLDMIIGSRFITKKGFQSSGLRRVGIRFLSLLIKICTGKTVTDPTSGMRMINKGVIHYFAENYPKDYPETETVAEIIAKGFKVAEIPVKMRARENGVSSISAKKSVYFMIKVSLSVIVASTRKIKGAEGWN